jgi:outer membrane protein OmpA-like peptidoglycan-associated protein
MRSPLTLLGALALAATVPGTGRAETADGARPLVLAQGAAQTEEEKAKRRQQQKGAPATSPRQNPPPGSPPPKAQPGPYQGTPPAGRSVRTPPPDPKPPFTRPGPSGQPPAAGTAPPPPRVGTPPPDPKKGPEWGKPPPRQVVPRQPPPTTATPPSGGPPQGYAPSVAPKLPKGPGAVGTPDLKRVPPPVSKTAVPRFQDVQKARKERVEGDRRVIEEPGNRLIVRQGNRAVIRHDEAARFLRHRNAKSERRPDGTVRTFYARPDGTRVFTEVDRHGRLVRRYRVGRDGREHHLIDNRRFLRNAAIGVGIAAGVGLAILALAPPRVSIAREKYIVDYESASDDDLYEALSAPPVEELERAYSLDEIRDNYELRQRMRRIELGNIHFEFGAWEVTPDQYPRLERLARAILRVLRRNEDETFLIEGHTDLVGSDVDNLSLSDRRAEAVAEVLAQEFGVPPENLITQGYGEQFPRVPTLGAEPRNRRVEVRRVTPLMAER